MAQDDVVSQVILSADWKAAIFYEAGDSHFFVSHQDVSSEVIRTEEGFWAEVADEVALAEMNFLQVKHFYSWHSSF